FSRDWSSDVCSSDLSRIANCSPAPSPQSCARCIWTSPATASFSRLAALSCRRGLVRAEILARQHPLDQGDGLLDAVKRDEGAHARPLRLTEQRLIERLEPVAEVFELILVADLEDLILDVGRIDVRR